MDDLMQYKDIYLTEAFEHIKLLNDNLLAIEKDTKNKDLLQELMRSSHTLKGASATMGFYKTSLLTHVMEDVFDMARKDNLEITPQIISILFETVDVLESSINSIKETSKEIDLSAQIEKLKTVTGVKTENTVKTPTGVLQIDIKPAQSNAQADEKKASVEVDHISVPVERLDQLLALTEELTTCKMRLSETAKNTPNLEQLANNLERIVKDLSYTVMQARLVPIGQVFGRFPRLVRDLSTQMNKTIDLQISGNDIELDRTIVDKLGEPLLHLLRNAVDHGVEKSGTIKLSALRQNDFVVIEVEDDGKGIDYKKVKEVALKLGIIEKEQAEKFNNMEIAELIYDPRLSTKDQITETSGRGIGMNVVKEFVEQNGGRIEILSPVNNGGTRFTLKLPLSLAIIHSLLVKVSDTVFAIPFSIIERTVRVESKDVKKMLDTDVAVVDGADVPLIYLDNLVSDFDAKKKLGIYSGDKIVVIIRNGEDTVGLVVDSIVDELEITVKPLPPALRKTKGFSGSSVLGNGEMILIIDGMSLIDYAKNNY